MKPSFLAAMTEKHSSSYCKYLPITINDVSCSALLDSGNVWRSAISQDFLHKLGLNVTHLRPLPNLRITTAKNNSALNVLGELTKPLHLRLGPHNSVLRFTPVVIADLAMPVNISGPFLRQHGIDQLHSSDCVRFQGQDLPVFPHDPSQSTAPEVASSHVYLLQATTIPAMSVITAPAYIAAIHNPQQSSALPRMTAGDGLLEGGVDFSNHTQTVPWSHSWLTPSADGIVPAGIANPTATTITVPAGTRYGRFTLTCTPDRQDQTPWRIAVMTKEDNEATAEPQKPSLAVKLAIAIRKARQEMAKPGQAKSSTQLKTDDDKRKWIREQFKLTKSPSLTTEQQREKAVSLLLKYWDTLSVDGEYGTTHLMEHAIHTEPGPPIKCRHRPINPSLEPNLKQQINDWKQRDVIETSTSPWSFPLVAAPKKNGKIRWCVDYRRLNAITKKDSFPLPLIDDNLARLSNSRIFSCIDGSGAFHVIKIRKPDRQKTAFSTPWGLYQFKSMPFGLTNGPASYSRLVQLVLDGIPGDRALPYLDDTIIHSRSAEDHFRNLEQVLDAHRRAGLKLQPSKCQLFQDQVAYLGHLVTPEGIKPLPEYVRAVKEWPLPKNKSEARMFIGKVGYYRRFIKNFSGLAAPWTDVTGKDTEENEKKPLDVTPAMKAAFEDLKSRLVSAPILAFPRFDTDEPFIVDTDWSQDANAIGGTLSQKQDGKERVIAFSHTKLSKSQAKYPATKGEVCALLFHLNHWRYYLKYRPFIVRTDHLPLKSLHTMKPLDNHVARWLSAVADFDFTVVHRPGKRHINADALSRAPHIRDAPEPDEPVCTDDTFLDSVLGSITEDHLGTLAQAEQQYTYSLEHLRGMQEEDETLKLARQWIKGVMAVPNDLESRGLSMDAQIYKALLPQLFLDPTGLLRYRYREDPNLPNSERSLICLPRDLWDDAIRKAHEVGGHMALDNTLHRLRRTLWFPGMRKEVAIRLASCRPCQMKRRPDMDQRHTLVSPVEGFPFQRVCIDFVGPLTPSSSGKKFILTVRDTFTKWLEAYPLRQANATAVAKVLESQFFCRFGIPDSIHSDQGAQFTSGFFQDLARLLGIRATQTPAYNPKSNPVERVHRDLGNILRATLSANQGRWEELLPQAVFALNTSRSTATRVTPFQALFGREPSTPLECLFGRPPETFENQRSYADYLIALRDRMDAVHDYIRRNVDTAVTRRRRAYHQDQRRFRPGQLVWLFTPALEPGMSRKLSTFWTGPWTILAEITPVLFRIQAPATWRLRKSIMDVSIDRLRLYVPDPRGRPWEQRPTDQHQLELHGDMFAEHLHDGDGALPEDDFDVGPTTGCTGHGGNENNRGPEPRGGDDDDDDYPDNGNGPAPPPAGGGGPGAHDGGERRNPAPREPPPQPPPGQHQYQLRDRQQLRRPRRLDDYADRDATMVVPAGLHDVTMNTPAGLHDVTMRMARPMPLRLSQPRHVQPPPPRRSFSPPSVRVEFPPSPLTTSFEYSPSPLNTGNDPFQPRRLRYFPTPSPHVRLARPDQGQLPLTSTPRLPITFQFPELNPVPVRPEDRALSSRGGNNNFHNFTNLTQNLQFDPDPPQLQWDHSFDPQLDLPPEEVPLPLDQDRDASLTLPIEDFQYQAPALGYEEDSPMPGPFGHKRSADDTVFSTRPNRDTGPGLDPVIEDEKIPRVQTQEQQQERQLVCLPKTPK